MNEGKVLGFSLSSDFIFVPLADVNLLLELLIELQLNDEALEILCQFCSTQFSSNMSADSLVGLSPDKQLEAFNNVIMPDEAPCDINSKLIVLLINLKAKNLVKVCKIALFVRTVVLQGIHGGEKRVKIPR